MTCGSGGNNRGFACIRYCNKRNVCLNPIEVLRKIAVLQCSNAQQDVYNPQTLTTYENLDWQFDNLFEGRSVVNIPCGCTCPVFRCAGRRVRVRSLRKCPRNKSRIN